MGACLAGLSPARAAAWCQMTTSLMPVAPGECPSEGFPLAWRRPCISYAVDRRSSADLAFVEVQRILAASVATWVDASCGAETTGLAFAQSDEPADCTVAEYNTDARNVNAIMFIADWTERGYDNNAYALTTVWHSTRTGEIFDADMELNENRGPYGECPAPDGCADGTVDLQNVATHEMGHFLGLAHSWVADATMYAAAPPGEVQKRDLHGDDVDGLCSVYPPGSLAGACDFTPSGGLSLLCDGGSEDPSCGCATPGRPLTRGREAAALGAALAVFGLGWVRRRRRGGPAERAGVGGGSARRR